MLVRKLALLSLVASPLLLACGSAGDELGQSSQSVEQTGTSTAFLLWNPASALITEHSNWHGSCGGGSGPPCVGSSGRGTAFLKFHRNFLERLRDDFERQGVSADITPWYRVPTAITQSGLWTSADRAAEQAVLTMVDPATGQRFASLDRFGAFIEAEYHNRIHSYAASVYGETILNNAGMSPKSTYFFKIHGLIEWHLQRFLNGDFDQDGKSDLVMLNTANGTRGTARMSGTTFGSANLSVPALPSGCTWYLGATPDIDYNGSNDLIYHSPDCARVIARLMQSGSPTQPIALPAGMVEMGSVNSDWTLIGTGDFDNDVRPDLVWRNTSGIVVVWFMNGTAIRGDRTYTLPAGWNAQLPADVDGNGRPDLVMSKQASDGGVDYAAWYDAAGSAVALTGLTRSPFLRMGAAGYFSFNTDGSLGSQTRRQADFMFIGRGPGAPNESYTFQLSASPGTYGSLISMTNPNNSWQYSGPR